MKLKARVKIAVDALMTLGLLFLMGYQFWGDVAHEWAGAGMFVLFILHHVFNGGWYKSLFRGKHTPFRVFQIVVDCLVLLDMLGLMVSGVILSNHVFAFLPIRGGTAFARTLHMLASFWGFLLMALHLGLHWNVFLGLSRKLPAFQKPSRRRAIVLNILGGAVALYGVVAFFRRDLSMYLFLRTHFVFFNFSEPIPLFYLDYLAIMGLFVFLAHAVSKLLRKMPYGKRGKPGVRQSTAPAGQNEYLEE